MTASVRKQIVDFAIAALQNPTPTAPLPQPPASFPTVWDTRLESFSESELPAIVVFEIREDGQSEKEGRWGYFVKRAFTLRVEIRVASGTPRVAVDPFYVFIGQTLPMAPQSFGIFNGLIEDCYETLLEWQYADTDQPYTLLQIDYRVEYSTLKNDPTAIN